MRPKISPPQPSKPSSPPSRAELEAQLADAKALYKEAIQGRDEIIRSADRRIAEARSRMDAIANQISVLVHAEREREAAVDPALRKELADAEALERKMTFDLRDASKDVTTLRRTLDAIKKAKADAVTVANEQQRLLQFESRCGEIEGKLANAKRAAEEVRARVAEAMRG